MISVSRSMAVSSGSAAISDSRARGESAPGPSNEGFHLGGYSSKPVCAIIFQEPPTFV
jgi:hypothetical protein